METVNETTPQTEQIEAVSDVAASSPPEPITRVDPVQLLPAFKADLEKTRAKLPNVRTETLKTLSRVFQSLLHSWTPTSTHPHFTDAVRLYVELLATFRRSQRVEEPLRSELGLMSDTEITDCGLSDLVRVSDITLRDFIKSPRSAKVRSNLFPFANELKNAWFAEGQEHSQRAKALRARKAKGQSLKLNVPGADLNLTPALEATLAPLLPKPEVEESKAKVLVELTATIQSIAPNAKCELFGSAANGFGFATSDIDVALHPEDFSNLKPDEVRQRIRPESIQADLGFREREASAVAGSESAEEWLAQVKPEGLIVLRAGEAIRDSNIFSDVETIATARVPVVKMIHRTTGFQCDVAVGNALAVHNTALLRAYSQLSPAARTMILGIKLWAKRRGVGDASQGFLSSYAWTLLALYYLQHCPSALGGVALPNLQTCSSLVAEDVVDTTIDGFKVRYVTGAPETAAMSKCINSSPPGTLLRGFFAFYVSHFNLQNDSISFNAVAAGSKLPRKGADVTKWRFSIIDPFELTHDLGTTLSGRRAQTIISEELHRAFEIVSVAHSSGAASWTPEQAEQVLLKLFSTSDAVQGSRIGARPCLHCGEGTHRTRQCSSFSAELLDTQGCYICGSKSHLARDCHIKEAERQSLKTAGAGKNVTCYVCKQRGHMAKDCPERPAAMKQLPKLDMTSSGSSSAKKKPVDAAKGGRKAEQQQPRTSAPSQSAKVQPLPAKEEAKQQRRMSTKGARTVAMAVAEAAILSLDDDDEQAAKRPANQSQQPTSFAGSPLGPPIAAEPSAQHPGEKKASSRGKKKDEAQHKQPPTAVQGGKQTSARNEEQADVPFAGHADPRKKPESKEKGAKPQIIKQQQQTDSQPPQVKKVEAKKEQPTQHSEGARQTTVKNPKQDQPKGGNAPFAGKKAAAEPQAQQQQQHAPKAETSRHFSDHGESKRAPLEATKQHPPQGGHAQQQPKRKEAYKQTGSEASKQRPPPEPFKKGDKKPFGQGKPFGSEDATSSGPTISFGEVPSPTHHPQQQQQHENGDRRKRKDGNAGQRGGALTTDEEQKGEEGEETRRSLGQGHPPPRRGNNNAPSHPYQQQQQQHQQRRGGESPNEALKSFPSPVQAALDASRRAFQRVPNHQPNFTLGEPAYAGRDSTRPGIINLSAPPASSSAAPTTSSRPQQQQRAPREEDFPMLNPQTASKRTLSGAGEAAPGGFSYAEAAIVGMLAPVVVPKEPPMVDVVTVAMVESQAHAMQQFSRNREQQQQHMQSMKSAAHVASSLFSAPMPLPPQQQQQQQSHPQQQQQHGQQQQRSQQVAPKSAPLTIPTLSPHVTGLPVQQSSGGPKEQPVAAPAKPPAKKQNWAELEEQEDARTAALAAAAAASAQPASDRVYKAGGHAYSFQELQRRSLEQKQAFVQHTQQQNREPSPRASAPPAFDSAGLLKPLPKPVLPWNEPSSSGLEQKSGGAGGSGPPPSTFTLPPLPGYDASVPLPPRFSLPPPDKL